MSRRIPLLAILLSLCAIAFSSTAADTKTAVFAGGCFWCVEADFDKVAGVTETISGFAGGHVANPSYKAVVRGGTGHLEVVQVTYDPTQVSFEALLDVFWHSVDPTDGGGQFCDRGESYTTAIFVNDDEERELAEQSKQRVQKTLDAPIVTPIRAAATFYPAEDYHQNYYRSQDRILSRFGYVTKEKAYKGYRKGCGRDAQLKKVWGDSALKGIAGK